MKLFNYIISSLLVFSVVMLAGCSKDENTLSKAVLASASELSFASTNASEKIITVYADADWVSEAPDWVTVTPSQGTGTMDVTISVSDNMRSGSIDNPRKETLVFRGGTLASRAEVIISQEGDKYRDCPNVELSAITGMNDEAVLSVSDAIVAAVTTNGFIATDATNSANIFMQSTASVNVGNKVTVKGSKNTESNSLVYVECDDVTVSLTGESVAYPEATDITSQVDSYKSTDRAFISASGILNGNKITITDATNQVMIVNAPESLGLSALNGHKVTVKGYYAGTAAPVVKIMAAELTDNGLAEQVYFSDDFEWMNSWAEASGAGQTVENDDSGASAPNIFTSSTLGDDFVNALQKTHGYTLIYKNANNATDAVYLQQNYLKFGKTSFEAGIVLPSIAGIPAGEKLNLSFDWCPMITGSHKYDATQVVVIITNDGVDNELASFSHSFKTGDKMEWLHASVDIDGITITKDTKITIRSKDWTGTKSAQRRWFLDNIKLKKR